MDVNSTIELTHSEFSTPKIMFAFPKLKTSAKFVQTSVEVSRKYDVLTKISARTYNSKYT